MPPKGSSTAVNPIRLPPLHKLRIRRPNKVDANPCVGIMTSVLSCWASSGFGIQGCAQIESQLRACMDAPRPPQAKKNTINHHLGRLYPKISPPTKKGK